MEQEEVVTKEEKEESSNERDLVLAKEEEDAVGSIRPMSDINQALIKSLNQDVQIMADYNRRLKDLENRKKQLIQRGMMLEKEVLTQINSDPKPEKEKEEKKNETKRGFCYTFSWVVLFAITVAACIWAPPLAIFLVFIGLFGLSIYVFWSLFVYLCCCCFRGRKNLDQQQQESFGLWKTFGNFWIYVWFGIALFLFTVYNYLTTIESWKEFEELWMLEKTLNQTRNSF